MARLVLNPLLLLAAALAMAVALLSVRTRLPIGANYWDLYFVLDGAWRLLQGQTPHVDFFAPAGALPFAATALALHGFPAAHPLLAAQFGLLALTGPLMALAVFDSGRRAPWVGALLVIPFAFLSLTPINGVSFFPAPGADGVGLYNRHAGLLLYALIAALVFAGGGWRAACVVGVTLAALFFTKINAFIPAIGFVAVAAVAGLISLRALLASAALAVALILALGLPGGLLGSYLSDLGALAAFNSGRLFERLLTAMSVRFDALAALAVVAVVLAWTGWTSLLAALSELITGRGQGRWQALRDLAAQPAALVASFGLGALAIEAQNTGSQEYLFLWPLLLSLLAQARLSLIAEEVRGPVTLALACAALVIATPVLHRMARMAAAAPTYRPVATPTLGMLDSVSAKASDLDDAQARLGHYAAARDAYLALARTGRLPSTLMLSEPSFQTLYLLSLEDAARALLNREAQRGRSYASIAALDSVDPFALALRRAPMRELTVSFDLGRGFPAARHSRQIDAWGRTEALLLPRCPMASFRLDAETLAAPALAGRRIVPLTPCWDLAERL